MFNIKYWYKKKFISFGTLLPGLFSDISAKISSADFIFLDLDWSWSKFKHTSNNIFFFDFLTITK